MNLRRAMEPSGSPLPRKSGNKCYEPMGAMKQRAWLILRSLAQHGANLDNVARNAEDVPSEAGPMGPERQIEGCTYYTVSEIARRLGLCPETIRRLIRTNELPAGRLGRTYFIRGDEIHRALNERDKQEEGG